MRYFVSQKSIPESARYIGSTEGPDTISEETANAIEEAIEPAYSADPDGTRHFFDLCPDF